MGLHHLHTSECLMYDSQACVTCIHEFFTLWAHGTLYLNEPHICYSLMYDLWACVACSVHQFFTSWACASQSSCVQLMGLWHPLCRASHPSHIQLTGLHCPYTHFYLFILWAHAALSCLVYNLWACIALIHVFIYLFCGLALPSVVLDTTYRPALPLYHEHI